MSDIELGGIVYDTDCELDQNMMCNVDYQSMLENVPIEEIQKFLRKKKLENIEKI